MEESVRRIINDGEEQVARVGPGLVQQAGHSRRRLAGLRPLLQTVSLLAARRCASAFRGALGPAAKVNPKFTAGTVTAGAGDSRSKKAKGTRRPATTA